MCYESEINLGLTISLAPHYSASPSLRRRRGGSIRRAQPHTGRRLGVSPSGGYAGSPARRSAAASGAVNHRGRTREASPIDRRQRVSHSGQHTRHRKQTRDAAPTKAGGGAAPRARGRRAQRGRASETGAPGRGHDRESTNRETSRGSGHGSAGPNKGNHRDRGYSALSSRKHHRPGRTRQRTAPEPGNGSQTHRDADNRTKRESRQTASRKSAEKQTKAGTTNTGRATHRATDRQRHRDRRGAHNGRAQKQHGDGGGETEGRTGAPSETTDKGNKRSNHRRPPAESRAPIRHWAGREGERGWRAERY